MPDAPRQYGVSMACFDPAVGSRISVTLDGKPVSQVLSYDMDAGHLLRHKTDAEGKPIINEDGDQIERELLTGMLIATLADG